MEDFWDKSNWFVFALSESICRLPRRNEWADVPTKPPELWNAVGLAVPILLIRLGFESFVGLGLGRLLGYVEEPLGSAARRHLIGGFHRQTKTKKVLECFWRLSSYSFLFCFGLTVLHSKPWFHDGHQCYIGYPEHSIDTDVWWYYMTQTGFYFALLIGSISDVKRSDFWEMSIHHLITLALLWFSWTINFVRVGTLILLCHDVNDIFLELAKLFRYSRKHTAYANAAFGLFLLSWIATRLLYFPFFIVLKGVRDAPSLIQPDYEILQFSQKPFAPRVLLLMLLCLLALHIFWSILIFKIVLRTLRSGEASDVRSDSEESEAEEYAIDVNRNKVFKKRRDFDKKEL